MKTPICFITDEVYAIPTLVAIESLYLNRGFMTRYEVYVLGTGNLTQELRRSFSAVHSDVHFIELDSNAVYDSIPAGNRHVSTTALFKFNLAEFFPQFDRLLYLDSDIIVQRNLSDLLQLDLQDKYAAVVDSFSALVQTPNPLDYLPCKHYFNSGVMLLNLKKIREDGIKEKLIDYRLHGWNHYMDQDSLNAVFHDEVIFLPFEYNLMYTSTYRFSPKEISELYSMNEPSSWADLCRKAFILHFNGPEKPWLFSNTWNTNRWYYYYSRLANSVPVPELKRIPHEHPRQPEDATSLKRDLFWLRMKHVLRAGL